MLHTCIVAVTLWRASQMSEKRSLLRSCLILRHSKLLPWGEPANPKLANKVVHRMRG